MLKFVVEKEDQALLGLGLSQENVRRLRGGEAIQFRGSDLGLPGVGIFVIAHESDPELPTYRAMPRELLCELVVLSEADCATMAGDLLTRELGVRRQGLVCGALLFSGSSEEEMVAALREQGLITDSTHVVGPDPPARATTGAAAPAATVYRVQLLDLLKLGGGGAFFLVMTVWMGMVKRVDGVTAMVLLMMATCGLVMLTMAWSHVVERVHLDQESIHLENPFVGFDLSWREVAAVRTVSDSLGPYELHLETQAGKVHKLRRRYDGWDELIQQVIQEMQRPR